MASVGQARFVGKVVVVSGAANGIGRATALRFAREGAHVVAVDREEDALDALAEIMERMGARMLPLVADWTEAAAVHDAFAAARRELGRIDILFNNVGQSARERAT